MKYLLEMFGLTEVIDSLPLPLRIAIYVALGLVGVLVLFLVKVVFRLAFAILKGAYSMIRSLFSKRSVPTQKPIRKAA